MNPTKRLIARLLLISIFSVSARAEEQMGREDFFKVFDAYVGVWKGEYKIYSLEDQILNDFKVERHYWWNEGALMARVRYDFGAVQRDYSHRIIYSDGIPFLFVAGSDNPEKVKSGLKGEFEKGTLLWTRVLPKGGLPVRISERVITKGNDKSLEYWGDQEARDRQGNTILVRMEGFLSYLPESRDLPVEKVDVKDVEDSESVLFLQEEVAKQSYESVKEEKQQLSSKQKKQEAKEKASESNKQKNEVQKNKHVESSSLEKKEPKKKREKKAAAKASKKGKPVEPAKPNPKIQRALSELNVVGINDREGSQSIVVDYFLLYNIGDRLSMKDGCVFSRMDEESLYFEDFDGIEYRLPRKDR